MAELDFDQDMANGTKSVEDIEASIDTSTLESIGEQVDAGGFADVYSDALENGSRYKKQIFGFMKEPRPAKFVVVDMNSKIPVVASNKFLLTGVRRETREKFQVLHSFDERWMLSTFGKDVPVYSLSGVLINLKDDQDWVRDFHYFYENWLRASQLVKSKQQAVLYYSNRMIRGYPIGKIEMDDSSSETSVAFNMNMLVRKDKIA